MCSALASPLCGCAPLDACVLSLFTYPCISVHDSGCFLYVCLWFCLFMYMSLVLLLKCICRSAFFMYMSVGLPFHVCVWFYLFLYISGSIFFMYISVILFIISLVLSFFMNMSVVLSFHTYVSGCTFHAYVSDSAFSLHIKCLKTPRYSSV